MSTLVSLREYARRRGVTLRAVQKAVESGRVSLVKDEKGNLKVDPEAADKQWRDGTDPAKQRSPNNLSGDEDNNSASTYSKARAMREAYMARMAKIDFEERSGKLVESDKVQVEWQKIVTTAKSRLLAVPSKIRARIPHMTVADIATIEEEIREALVELSGGQS